ncbi:MAG: ribonucleoside-diphosphate reductase subunit alpha [Actinobacteria bacterium]|nr:ribonucleoside-diphosphate reductase subunit alpha [Actinomycetota bacterium]
MKRTGELVPFERSRIEEAISKAFDSLDISDQDAITRIAEQVQELVLTRFKHEQRVSVESIQDIVEDKIMANGFHRVAKNFILYREKRALLRKEKTLALIRQKNLKVKVNETETVIFNPALIEEWLRKLAPDLMRISITEMVEAVVGQIYNNIPQAEINLLILNAACDRIEKHYEYSYLAARITNDQLYQRLLSDHLHTDTFTQSYRKHFKAYLQNGVDWEILSPDLLNFDLQKMAKALDPNRDNLFMYLGTQILNDRYLLRDRTPERQIFELPQWFWMRVAMGLAIKEPEKDRERHAIDFYTILSKMDLVSSTPTLFNSGTLHSQMSSCYLNLAEDSLDGIFKLYADNAKLSKWAGGIGTDWSYVRATGSRIKGTNGLSQGVIPFIKIFNDVALAVNQGGKRKGAMCGYMEVWHLDIEQFLELRKNTGDERRRTHDINTAAWIPDLFMKRVINNEDWTLFCPGDAPELHELSGKAFEKKYVEYEKKKLPRARTMKALDLWRKMLTMLYETGHPWVTFKDACNIRSPQDHVGVVHSSNLCTEITLNTSKDETAVCNLASINLAHMIKGKKLDHDKIKKTVKIGIRMLDNVIDNNFYPTVEAKNANFRHRAIGLGLMGYQDALFKLDIQFESDANVTFADESMEAISYFAILASSELAKERGSYKTFKKSKWDRGIFPLDSVDVLEKERGVKIEVNRNTRLDWDTLKSHVKSHGIRNSNIMAIAPTATIANISGVYPCTEPVFRNIYWKENLSGNFVVMNRYLIDDLEKLGLWESSIIQKIKLANGSISEIDSIPESIRDKYKETFEIDMKWLTDCASNRMKWIDQSCSTNIFMKTQSGKALSEVYLDAWRKGLKTTYYLRTLAATQVINTTAQAAMDAEPAGDTNAQPHTQAAPVMAGSAQACSILDPECEACQ